MEQQTANTESRRPPPVQLTIVSESVAESCAQPLHDQVVIVRPRGAVEYLTLVQPIERMSLAASLRRRQA
jgi:hypothetical protein